MQRRTFLTILAIATGAAALGATQGFELWLTSVNELAGS